MPHTSLPGFEPPGYDTRTGRVRPPPSPYPNPFARVEGARSEAFGALQRARTRETPFAQGLLQRFQRPPGMSAQTLQARRAQAAGTIAGGLRRNMRQFQQTAAARGLGGGAAATFGEAQLRAGAGRDVELSQQAIAMENEMLMQQQLEQAAQQYIQLLGLDAETARAIAQAQLSQQFPVFRRDLPGYQAPQGGVPGAAAPHGSTIVDGRFY